LQAESTSTLKKVKHFDYECNDESGTKIPDNIFKVLLNQAIMSTTERFDQIKNFHLPFGFLFDISALKTTKTNFSLRGKNIRSWVCLMVFHHTENFKEYRKFNKTFTPLATFLKCKYLNKFIFL
jgi:hypothetical protein